jgi:hypothetical protein
LSFTHIKRFNVRALYSLSQAETEQSGVYQYGDRVRLIRLEGKLSPTTTESLSALFRSRDVGRQTDKDGAYWRSLYHWELISGAQSTIIPGLVPKLNYNVFYNDCRTQVVCSPSAAPVAGASPWANTGPAGSAVFLPGADQRAVAGGPDRDVQGTIGGALGIYPGAWVTSLGPLALVPSVAVGDSEHSTDNLRTQVSRVYDYVGTEVWAGRKLEVSLYQRYRYTTTGPMSDQSATMTVLQNRIVYRPVFTSPITLLVNYEGDRSRDIAAPSYVPGLWAETQTHADMLEWLMRWNQIVTTRTRLKGGLERTSGTSVVDPTTQVSTSANHSKYSYGGEIQLRLYPLPDVSALYVYVSAEYKQWDSRGDAAYTAWELIPMGGVIWRLGDKLYLDGHFNYDYLHCLSGATCTTTAKILPYVFFTMNL